MQNTILITDRLVDPEQIAQLTRDRHRVKVLYLFEPEPDLEHLRLLEHLPWVEKILIEDRLFKKLSPLFSLPTAQLGDYVYTKGALPAPDPQQPFARGTVLFVPCNDTHVKMLLPIAQEIPNRMFLCIRGENGPKYLEEHGEPHQAMELRLFQSARYQEPLGNLFRDLNVTAVVFGNDWVGENWRICLLARRFGIPSICIQEGPQDYELEGGWQHQMEYADYIFSQGLVTLQYLETQRFYVSGNPRLTAYHPLPLPEPPQVLINSNFTYGVHEDARDTWVADCVEACAQNGVEYFISQHPRDMGNLSKYRVIKSDAFKLPEQMAQASVVITRFSQLVHEAMLSGRQVIYYNPHGEVKRTHTEDRSGGFFHAHDLDSLRGQLAAAVQREFPNALERDICNRIHCGPCDHREVERCLQGIAQIVHQHGHERAYQQERERALQPDPEQEPSSASTGGAAPAASGILASIKRKFS